MAERLERVALEDEIDEQMRFARITERSTRVGWLTNVQHPSRASLNLLRCRENAETYV